MINSLNVKNSTTALVANSGLTKEKVISGAAVSLLSAGTVNAMKVRDGEITPAKAVREVVKRTTQGTIATASIVAATNYKGQNSGMLKALTALSIGALGVYAVEVLDKKLDDKEREFQGEVLDAD